MILNTNSAFFQGSSHSVCEDYALSGLKSYNIDNDAAYALIADGCSGSINTDVGSRLISICAKNRLNYYLPEESSFRMKLLEDVDMHRVDLQLNKDALDATLLFLQSDDKEYEFRAYGDGAFLKLNYDGNIEFTLIEYPSNAPLYLSYYLDDRMFDRYKAQFGLERIVYKYIITPTEFSYSSEKDTTGEPYIESGKYNYKVIAVTSDGIASFGQYLDKNFVPSDIVNIVRQVMDFKSIKGKFIERRLNAFKTYCEKNSLKHLDDFSMSGISFEK